MSHETPKPRSVAFAELRERLSSLLDQRALAVIAHGALDRQRIERIVQRLSGGKQGPLADVPRNELIAQLAVSFFESEAAAWELVNELDRATRGERSLVASTPAAKVVGQLGGGRALEVRRHGAKLIWAMARDARPEIWPQAGALVRAFVEQSRSAPEPPLLDAPPPHDAVAEVEARHRQQVAALQAEIEAGLRERARLESQVGEREAALHKESERRKALAEKIALLEKETVPQVEAPAAPDKREVERRLRQVEKRLQGVERERDELAGSRARVTELEEENARLRQTLDRLRELRSLERQRERAIDAEPSRTPVVEAPKRQLARRAGGTVRVGLFVDVANLSGAARRLFDRAVDYRQLLVTALGGRRLVEARAYAIDKDAGFAAFAQALRDAGYRVQGKQPRTFDDGSVKADWDVGLAVDALLARDKLDVVILGSGDGDFVPVVAALKRLGVQVEAAAFAERSADDLVRAVDRFIALDAAVLE